VRCSPALFLPHARGFGRNESCCPCSKGSPLRLRARWRRVGATYGDLPYPYKPVVVDYTKYSSLSSVGLQRLLIVHELAHVFEAVGFVTNDYPSGEARNTALIVKDCSKTLTAN
jgi:hypothetical protein